MYRLISKIGWILLLLGLAQVVQSAPLNFVQTVSSSSLTLPQPALLQNPSILAAVSGRPVLTSIRPGLCVNPGQRVQVNGHSLGHQDRRQLVMATGRQQFILSVTAWTANQISSRLPKNFIHRDKVEIGIRSAHKWQGSPLSIKVCRTTRADSVSSKVDGVTVPSMIELTAPLLPITILAQPALATTPPPLPTDPANPQSAPAAGNNEGWAEQDDNPALAQPRLPAGGDLLGTALPPVPAALHLVAPDNGTQQYSPHELVAVTASMDDARALAQVMQSFQARIVRRRKLGSLGMVISSFRLPDQVSVSETLKDVRKKYSDLWVDLNHYFHPLSAADKHRTSLYHAIGLRATQACGRGRRLGILDGPVDMQHPALHGQAVVQKQIFAHGQPPAPLRHATAVVSLLVGRAEVTGLGGVITDAIVYVGVVMQTGKHGEIFSSVENLLAGLDWLLSQRVQVISLSLGGPHNALLDVALKRVMGKGVGVVAAAGNGGRHAPPSYPAAQAGVVAVTDVDRNNVVASDASQGDYIDLAAPGVDLWVAAPGGGGRYTSGSSMAAPLVAAALARLDGSSTQGELLFRMAKDLGQPGKDPIYGWGMLQFPVCSYTDNTR